MPFMSPFVSTLSVVTAYVAFANRCDLERELRPAGARARNRVDPDQFGTFFDRARFQAGGFGLGPPRFALGLEKAAAATRQRDKDDGADEIQTNSTRHGRRFGEFT